MRKKNTHTRTENKWQSITIFTSNWNEFLYTGYDQSSSVTAGMIEWVFLGSLDSTLVSKCVLDATSLEYMLRCQYLDRSVIDNGSLLSTLRLLLNSTLVWSLAVGFQSAFDAGAFRESLSFASGLKEGWSYDVTFYVAPDLLDKERSHSASQALNLGERRKIVSTSTSIKILRSLFSKITEAQWAC